MARSLWIKLPTVLGTACAVLLLPGWIGWAVGTLVLLIGTALLVLLVVSVRSSFFAPTLWHAPAPVSAIALTFDDGPDPRHTPPILDILAQRGLQAAFFVVGERARRHPELLQRMHRDGHLVLNHSDRHGLDFHFRLWHGARDELARCDAAIRDAIGVTPRLFRSPQGFKNPALGDVLRASGRTAIGWQARGLDAVSRDASAIERRLVGGAQPGGVLALHDGAGLGGTHDRAPTIAALPRILDGLAARGLAVWRLDRLLQIDAYRKSS